jgi:hypothetical protein
MGQSNIEANCTHWERKERMRITANNTLMGLLALLALMVSVASSNPLATTAQSNISSIVELDIVLLDDCGVFNDSRTTSHKPELELSICETGLYQDVLVSLTNSQTDSLYHEPGILAEDQNACFLLFDRIDEDSKSMMLWPGDNTEDMISQQHLIQPDTVCETISDYGIIGMGGSNISRLAWESTF